MTAASRIGPSTQILIGLIVMFMVGVGILVWLYRRSGKHLFPSEKYRRLVPWGPGSVCAVFILYIAVFSVVFSSGDPKEMSLRARLVRLAIANMGIAVLIPPLLRTTAGATLSDLGLSSQSVGRNILLGAACCALALPAVYAVQAVAVTIWKPTDHLVQEAFTKEPSLPTALAAGFGAIIAASVVEELLFRGVLLAALWKIGSGEDSLTNPSVDLVANFAVSLLFASMHAEQWPAPIPLFFLSMGLGEVYKRSGSLIAIIVMHACFNSLSMAALVVASTSGNLPPAG